MEVRTGDLACVVQLADQSVPLLPSLFEVGLLYIHEVGRTPFFRWFGCEESPQSLVTLAVVIQRYYNVLRE